MKKHERIDINDDETQIVTPYGSYIQRITPESQSELYAKDLLAFVNSFNCDYAAFAKTIAGSHKTLQQSVMRLFIATIREMAKVTPDDRNAQTVKLAKEILKIADGYSLPLI